jgi:hypothetical protein
MTFGSIEVLNAFFNLRYFPVSKSSSASTPVICQRASPICVCVIYVYVYKLLYVCI